MKNYLTENMNNIIKLGYIISYNSGNDRKFFTDYKKACEFLEPLLETDKTSKLSPCFSNDVNNPMVQEQMFKLGYRIANVFTFVNPINELRYYIESIKQDLYDDEGKLYKSYLKKEFSGKATGFYVKLKIGIISGERLICKTSRNTYLDKNWILELDIDDFPFKAHFGNFGSMFVK